MIEVTWLVFIVASLISNPEIAVFFFAFLPQFVPPGAARATLSLLALVPVFAALTPGRQAGVRAPPVSGREHACPCR